MGVTEAAIANERQVLALQERIAQTCGRLNALHAELVGLIGEAIDTNAWEQWGIASVEQYVTWKSGLSAGRARQLVQLARRRDELPHTFGAFARGELSVDQTAVVVAHAPADVDAEVCAFAKAATVAQLRGGLSKYQWKRPLRESVARPTQDVALAMFDDEGRYHLKVNAPTDVGLIIDSAMREARDALFGSGHPDITWLDALREMAERSLDTVTSASRRDRYRVYLHVDTEPGETDDGPRAWVNGGPAAPAWLRDLICCNGEARPLSEQEGVPINVGRLRHIVPQHTRRVILDRDRTCRHPGCSARTFLEVHHIIEWIKGGMTDLENLAALCPKHHRAYHRGEFTMSGNANIVGGLRFFDARGAPIRPVGKPHPPDGPLQLTARYEHPSGERFNRHDLWFNQN
jgi:hypothetical protein